MSLDYIISVSVLINPIYRIPRAIGKRTMAGIFRSHGIRRGPSRGEGVVHAGAEVVGGVGEGKPRAEGQVVVLLHDGGGHQVGGDVDDRADVAQMVGGEQAVAVIRFNSITDS